MQVVPWKHITSTVDEWEYSQTLGHSSSLDQFTLSIIFSELPSITIEKSWSIWIFYENVEVMCTRERARNIHIEIRTTMWDEIIWFQKIIIVAMIVSNWFRLVSLTDFLDIGLAFLAKKLRGFPLLTSVGKCDCDVSNC